MRRKKFPAEVIGETVDFLTEKKFLDDDAFAKAWISSRISQSVGPQRISRELKLKGIARDIIERNLEELKAGYSESATLEELARQRLSRMKGLDPQTARRRVYGYLVRRGFSIDEIVDCLNKLSA